MRFRQSSQCFAQTKHLRDFFFEALAPVGGGNLDLTPLSPVPQTCRCQAWHLHPWQVCCLASLFHWNWLLLGGSAHKLVVLAPDHFWVLSLTQHICCRHTNSLAGSKHHVTACPILWKLSSLDALLGTQLSNSTVLVTLDKPGWH